ncbi:MAG: hypothetical protein OTJ98_10735, partial [Dehalococcoidia bacterium]|nr:hypothetical protein [Dehalococcoidia bacterium]
MKLKSTPLLLLSVVFILLVACGGESQVVAPTPEAEVVSNAMVEATAQATPTITPASQTVGPTPTTTVSDTGKSSQTVRPTPTTTVSDTGKSSQTV